MSIGKLIQYLNPGIYKQYILERYSTGEGGKTSFNQPVISIPSPRFDKMKKKTSFEHAELCSDLPENHFCIEYLVGRKIPKKYWNKLLFTSNYKNFIDSLIPEHDKNLAEDARLVILFYDDFDELIAVSGRALETNEKTLRYITMRVKNEDKKLLYGMDEVDLKETVKIVEGPIDSMFLKNCIASGDSNLINAAKELPLDTDRILIFDNEPRNREIINLMQVAINKGHKVLIWPDTIQEKDINAMVMSGLSKSKIEEIISSNVVSGIQAQTKFVYWKKV